MRMFLGAALSMLAALAVVAAIATAQTAVPVVAVAGQTPTAVSAAAAGPIAAGPTTMQIDPRRIADGAERARRHARCGRDAPGPPGRVPARRPDAGRRVVARGLATVHASVTFSGSRGPAQRHAHPEAGVLTVHMVSASQTPRMRRRLGASGRSRRADSRRGRRGGTGCDGAHRGSGVPGSATLPRRGTVRVQNFGAGPHIAIAFPLRRGVTNAQAGRAIRPGATPRSAASPAASRPCSRRSSAAEATRRPAGQLRARRALCARASSTRPTGCDVPGGRPSGRRSAGAAGGGLGAVAPPRVLGRAGAVDRALPRQRTRSPVLVRGPLPRRRRRRACRRCSAASRPAGAAGCARRARR